VRRIRRTRSFFSHLDFSLCVFLELPRDTRRSGKSVQKMPPGQSPTANEKSPSGAKPEGPENECHLDGGNRNLPQNASLNFGNFTHLFLTTRFDIIRASNPAG
jgi:hypothetical protein